MKRIALTLYAALFCFSFHEIKAQSDSTGSLSFSAYAEAYYSYDFGNPVNHERPGFLYNHKRHNEINVNLVYAKAAYTAGNYRANVALMAGNYVEYNLASEPGSLKNIFEANAGVKLSKKHNLWLDAGIMPSHIGFESAISADCWTLTRSMGAENSPYYETGAKVTYINKLENLTVSLLALNGWQRMHRPDGIERISGGSFIQYRINSKLSLVYATFIGSDKPDSLNALRVFHGVHLTCDTKPIGFIACFDIGQEQRPDGKFNTWYAPQIVSRIRLANRLKLVLRGEYYNDKDQVIIATGTPDGFQTLGTSVGLDCVVSDNALFRIEAKYYNSKDRIFYDNKSTGYENYCATASLSVKF